MKRRRVYQFMLLVVVGLVLVGLVGLPTSGTDNAVIRTFYFNKVQGIEIDILTWEAFQERFGDNLLIPQADEEIIELAQDLYTPEGIQVDEECGEDQVGALFAALSNPDISDATREEVDEIVDAAAPSLPETYTSGYFTFYYTTSNSNTLHNVTLAAIQATATILNAAWNDYAVNFIEPKHYVTSCGSKRINVKVWYLGPTLYGQTSSSWNYIELNSDKVVMNNAPCKRETTPVHELFHRCQYTYGYVTGTSIDKWAVEGTASWSQKHMADHVGDWMDRMDQGLLSPDKQLIGWYRSYDACHFWVYLGQRGDGTEADIIEDAWSEYSINGNDMRAAVEDTISNRTPTPDLDKFVQYWNYANFHKDFSNALSKYDYDEDESEIWCGGVKHGPLESVPRVATHTLIPGVPYNSGAQSVSAYGADYYRFNFKAIKSASITVNGSPGNTFSYSFVRINGNDWSTARHEGPGIEDYTYNDTSPLTAIGVVVTGNPDGGSYTVTASAS